MEFEFHKKETLLIYQHIKDLYELNPEDPKLHIITFHPIVADARLSRIFEQQSSLMCTEDIQKVKSNTHPQYYYAVYFANRA